jgi:hypothetical protein
MKHLGVESTQRSIPLPDLVATDSLTNLVPSLDCHHSGEVVRAFAGQLALQYFQPLTEFDRFG